MKKKGKLPCWKEIATVFGGGDFERGVLLLGALALQLKAARMKHPVFARGRHEALGAVREEFREFEYAVQKEGLVRQVEEVADLAVVVLRFLNGEYNVPEEQRPIPCGTR